MLVLLLTSATDRDGSAQADDKSELHGNIWLRDGAVLVPCRRPAAERQPV